MAHANAALTPKHRLRLARLIVDDGWPPSRAAEFFHVSWRTATKWAQRYREEGSSGMVDRSSARHSQHARTPQPVVRKIVYLRWKHTASLTVSRGDWSGLLMQRYSTGYNDQVPNGGKGTPPPGFDPRVHHYTKYDLSGTYTGFKNTTITVGIQNLFDTDPPFTAHNVDEVVGAGWDPRVADPRGRSLVFTLKYKFF